MLKIKNSFSPKMKALPNLSTILTWKYPGHDGKKTSVGGRQTAVVVVLNCFDFYIVVRLLTGKSFPDSWGSFNAPAAGKDFVLGLRVFNSNRLIRRD